MKALILCCGGSPEPLEFSIENFKTDFYYFIHSKKTFDVARMLVEEFNLNEDQYSFKLIEDHESLEDSYAKSREVIKELQNEFSDITVDFTGGTKPMVAGLVLAAIGEDCNYIYVGSKGSDARDKQGMGIVQNGFEAIKDQRDPYEVYAVMEFNKGFDFFNRYQFEAAKLNFIEASEKLESNNLRELAELFGDIVDVYDSWDKFNNLYNDKPIKSAFYELINRIENSEELLRYFNEEQPLFITKFKENFDFLTLKISRKGLIEIDDVKYYLPDLLNNAYRRIEEGKYDDAVARLYRTIELIAQLGLTNQHVIQKDVLLDNKEFKINLDVIDELENEDVKYFVYSLNEYENALYRGKRHMGIPSDKSFRLLSKFGVDYAQDYLNDKKFKSDVGSRNGSILAHGLNPITYAQAKELYAKVLSYSKRVFPDITKYMDMADFPKFK